MIDLRMNEGSELMFKLNIEGSEETPESRLVININEDFQLILRGQLNENNKVKVAIPALGILQAVLQEDVVPCHLEVIIDERYFIPWKSTAKITIPLVVQAESVETERPKKITEPVSVALNEIENQTEPIQIFEDFTHINEEENPFLVKPQIKLEDK